MPQFLRIKLTAFGNNKTNGIIPSGFFFNAKTEKQEKKSSIFSVCRSNFDDSVSHPQPKHRSTPHSRKLQLLQRKDDAEMKSEMYIFQLLQSDYIFIELIFYLNFLMMSSAGLSIKINTRAMIILWGIFFSAFRNILLMIARDTVRITAGMPH